MDSEDAAAYTAAISSVRLESLVDSGTDDDSVQDLSDTARELRLTGPLEYGTHPPPDAAASAAGGALGCSTVAREVHTLEEDEDEQEADEIFYAELMAGTEDESGDAAHAQTECGEAGTLSGLGHPATYRSASTEPLPARSAAAGVGQPPSKDKADRKDFKTIIDESIRNLPVASRVAPTVMRKVRERCAREARWLLPLASAAMDLPATRLEIDRIWKKLITALGTVFTGPANSTRASAFTMLRQNGRHGEMLAFVTQSAVKAAASVHFHDASADDLCPRTKRALTACYLFLEQATHDRLLAAVEDVNMVELRHPRGMLEMQEDRAAVLYMVSGWLLSSGFTHVRRNAHDRHLFLPLLNAFKYANKGDFDRRAPDNLRGVESEVVRRSEVYQGKSLLFVTAEFFRLVQRWEAGYRHAFSKSYLLGTFLGNLPDKIKKVVGRAEVVQLQWQQCVRAALGRASDPSGEQAVYEFLLQKFYNVRFAEYCRRLGMFSNLFRKEKAHQQALRSKLKATGAGNKTNAPPAKTGGGSTSGGIDERHERVKAGLRDMKFTQASFGKITVAKLKEHIVDVGGTLKGLGKSKKFALQQRLKALVPGIVASAEGTEALQDFDVREASAMEALDIDQASQSLGGVDLGDRSNWL